MHVAPEIPLFERKNWLLHLHYVRKDYERCKVSYCIFISFWCSSLTFLRLYKIPINNTIVIITKIVLILKPNKNIKILKPSNTKPLAVEGVSGNLANHIVALPWKRKIIQNKTSIMTHNNNGDHYYCCYCYKIKGRNQKAKKMFK